LKRHEIFITSKLAPVDQGYEKAIAAVELSLKKLDLKYIDLYLIHWPGTSKLEPSDPQNAANRRESWRGLEECVKRGYVKSIGVSNYLVKHLQEMLHYTKVMPAVNQFELHPAYVPEEEIKFCKEHKIFVQTYASLAEGLLMEEAFLQRNPEFCSIAKKHHCTLPQILLKWPLQRGWGIIPKSVKRGRIVENAQLFHFTLDEDDLIFLNNFHLKEAFKKCWNPESIH
jgi:diketogulonate reductase-like aldo/keto reductase